MEASEYKLFATQLSQRVANAMVDLPGPAGQLRVHTEEAPMRGRADMAYRYSVIDTIGGGASEIQKNIIARRKLGLPKNFLRREASTCLPPPPRRLCSECRRISMVFACSTSPRSGPRRAVPASWPTTGATVVKVGAPPRKRACRSSRSTTPTAGTGA